MSTAKKKLTSCQPKTAVAYARYSSAKQRDVSIEQQLQDIRAYAVREGYTIIHEYADRAKSGFKHSDRRAEFQAMLRDASLGEFDTVIAWKVDRFGRDRREAATYKGNLADVGVSVVYAMEPIPDGAVGCLTEGMLEAIAEWYSRNLSENVRRGRRDNATKCLFNGNKTFGYDKGPDGHYVINEAQAAVVRKVFSLYAQGYSAASIKNILDQDGIRTTRGNAFQISRITYMITNEAYRGIYRYDDIRIPGGMPAIIDDDTWETCQALRAKTARHFEKRPVDFYFSGKCTCSQCGGNVYGSSGQGRGKPYYYYSCDTSRRRGRNVCSLPSIRKERFEDTIFTYLFDNVFTGKAADRFADMVIDALKTKQKTSPRAQMERDLADVNRRIDNINNAISEGVWTSTTKKMLDDLTSRSEELQKNIAYLHMTDRQYIEKDRILFYFNKIASGNRDDPAFMKALANTVINSIVVHKDWLEIVINAAEHVEKIPPENLPPLELLPDLSRFALEPNGSSRLVTVETYPVVAFKIAI